MTLKVRHPFRLIVAVPTICGESTLVIRLLECREQLCDVVCKYIVWCYSENNAPHHFKNVTFFKDVPDLEIPPMLMVLDDLMDSVYSTKLVNYLPKIASS